MKKFALLAATVCGLMASAAPAQVTLMDQIGPTPFTNASVRASQRFETANVNFDAGVGDDFIVPAGPAQHLTLVEAVISGFNGFTVANYANVQNYSVEIYSSQAAAVANLNGNVAHVVIPAASAVLTPFGNDPQRLVSLNLAGSGVDLVPGTYFISVIPRIDFTGNGQTGLIDSTSAVQNPGGLNGFQANPGGGFGLPGNLANTLNNEPFRITSVPVPEPTSMALLGLVSAAGFGWRRWRKI